MGCLVAAVAARCAMQHMPRWQAVCELHVEACQVTKVAAKLAETCGQQAAELWHLRSLRVGPLRQPYGSSC